MTKAEVLAALRALPYDPRDYWLITGGAMVLYGLRPQTHDVDLGCTAHLADELEAAGYLQKRLPDGSRCFRLPGEIEVFENWLCGGVETVEGVPVVSLQGLLEMKQALGRDKDRKDAALIRDYLARNAKQP